MKTLTIIKRILALPFFFGMAFIGAQTMLVKWCINFIRFGGEAVAYTDKMNRKTIKDVFVKLTKLQESYNIKECSNCKEKVQMVSNGEFCPKCFV